LHFGAPLQFRDPFPPGICGLFTFRDLPLITAFGSFRPPELEFASKGKISRYDRAITIRDDAL